LILSEEANASEVADAMRLDGEQSQHMAIAVRDEHGPVMEVKFSFEIARKQ
jgi:hypothetical protein